MKANFTTIDNILPSSNTREASCLTNTADCSAKKPFNLCIRQESSDEANSSDSDLNLETKLNQTQDNTDGFEETEAESEDDGQQILKNIEENTSADINKKITENHTEEIVLPDMDVNIDEPLFSITGQDILLMPEKTSELTIDNTENEILPVLNAQNCSGNSIIELSIAEATEAQSGIRQQIIAQTPAEGQNKINIIRPEPLIPEANIQPAIVKTDNTIEQLQTDRPVKNLNSGQAASDTAITYKTTSQANIPDIKVPENSSKNAKQIDLQQANNSIPADNKALTNITVTTPNSAQADIPNLTKMQFNQNSNQDNNRGTDNNTPQLNTPTQLPINIFEHADGSAQLKTTPLQQKMPNNEITDINRQILDSLKSSLETQGLKNQLTVRLNPPELGQVIIKFQGQETQLTGQLEFSNTQTKAEFEHALPQIIRELTDSGIEVKKLEVVLSNNAQSEQQNSKEQLPFNGEQQQYFSSSQDSYQFPRSFDDTTNIQANDFTSAENLNMPSINTGDNSINILL